MLRSRCTAHPRYLPGCQDCQAASSEYARSRRAALAAGTWDGLVSPDKLERVHQHVAALLVVTGVTTRRVVKVAGVSHHALDSIRGGRSRRMTHAVADALLGVTVRACLALERTPDTNVSNVGTRRRLRALAVDGWSAERVGELVGIPPSVVHRHRGGSIHHEITWANHERYRLFYEKIQAQADPTGGSDKTSSRAAAKGWLGPERWADEDIDDPDALPLPPPPDTDDWVVVTGQIEGALRDPRPGKAADYPRDVQREIARQAIKRLGWSYQRVGELLGKSTNAVDYMLHGRRDRSGTWTDARRVRDTPWQSRVTITYPAREAEDV